jgi:hypothetical protein
MPISAKGREFRKYGFCPIPANHRGSIAGDPYVRV